MHHNVQLFVSNANVASKTGRGGYIKNVEVEDSQSGSGEKKGKQ